MNVREADFREPAGQVAHDFYADFAQAEDGHHCDGSDNDD
jgi:hypothetical protein